MQLGIQANGKKLFEGGKQEKVLINKKIKIWIALVAGSSTHVTIELIRDEIEIKK